MGMARSVGVQTLWGELWYLESHLNTWVGLEFQLLMKVIQAVFHLHFQEYIDGSISGSFALNVICRIRLNNDSKASMTSGSDLLRSFG